VLIESALKEKPGLLHSDYNLGRAEMLLGNDTAAAQLLGGPLLRLALIPKSFGRPGISSGSLPSLHRMEDAQKAMATFQKLKDEDAENSQKALKRYEAQQNSNVARPPPPQNP